MAFYKYLAKNEHGETVKGVVEAKDVNQAANALKDRQLFVIRLEPKSEAALAMLNSWLFGVKSADIVTLTRQLATMITAGLSLTEALNILQQQSRPAMLRMLDDLLREIEGGNPFAKSLEKYPKYFNKVYTQLVRAGEAAGILDQIMNRLADNLEKDREFKGKAKGALIYPMIVIIALVTVAVVMMIFVIPKLTEMYKDFGAELPLATQILIDVSDFMVKFWWLMGGALAAGGVLFNRWGKTIRGQRAVATFLLKVPLYGPLRKKVILTEFSRTLSLLLSAGISVLDGLTISADAIPLLIYREALSEATQKVEKGISLAQTLHDPDLFPPILTQMISVGEETGKLDEVLMKLAIYFQTESEQAIKNLTTALEPIIMIVLGLGVALMVVAIIMPIYNLTSQF